LQLKIRNNVFSEENTKAYPVDSGGFCLISVVFRHPEESLLSEKDAGFKDKHKAAWQKQILFLQHLSEKAG